MTLPLPDWNDLPDAAKQSLMREAGYFSDPDTAGQCAVNFFGEVVQILSEFYPIWARRTRSELATGDLFETPAYCRGQEDMRERAASVLEFFAPAFCSQPPHRLLLPDAEPDISRKLYAEAIRALPISDVTT